MSQQRQTPGRKAGASFVTKSLIVVKPDEQSAEKRWPRRWRYAFILATSAIFWIAVIAALRWA
jgi:hypothetical protein